MSKQIEISAKKWKIEPTKNCIFETRIPTIKTLPMGLTIDWRVQKKEEEEEKKTTRIAMWIKNEQNINAFWVNIKQLKYE